MAGFENNREQEFRGCWRDRSGNELVVYRNNPILQYVGTMKASDYCHICKLMYKTDYRSRI